MSTSLPNPNILSSTAATLEPSTAEFPDEDTKQQDDVEAATPTATPIPLARIDHFNGLFDTRSRKVAFWSMFGVFSVALAIAADTTPLYLAFATSTFQANQLLSTIGLLTSIMGGVLQPFWGRLADISARSYCFAGSLGLMTLGYALCAGSNRTQALAAGQIIYTIGSTGLSFLQTLIIADLTPLQSRGLAYGLVSVIYLPFAFVSPIIASGIGLESWRWGYGMFCIIMPVCSTPFLILLWRLDESTPKTKHGDSLGRRIFHSILLIDPLGLVLIGFACALLLSPLTLYAGAQNGWKNPSMIAMEVVGGIIFIMFCIWERKIAPHPLLPRRIFNRNYSLCFFTTFLYFTLSTVYNTYWSSWLWVVQDYTQYQWTYICETGAAALCAFGLIAGLVIRYTHKYKVLQICGVIIGIIGAGVNYYSAQEGRTQTITVVFAQLLLQGGGSFTLICAQTALQASVLPEDLAIAIAIYIFGESLGGGIGAAIAGSIWSNDLVANLAEYVPSLNATDILQVAGDITVARITEPRDGVISAFDATYRTIGLVTLVMVFFPLISALFNKEYVLDGRQTAAAA